MAAVAASDCPAVTCPELGAAESPACVAKRVMSPLIAAKTRLVTALPTDWDPHSFREVSELGEPASAADFAANVAAVFVRPLGSLDKQ